MAMGYKPIWQVLITPVSGTAQDVSYYVADGGQGGTVIDVQDATTDRASTFTVTLWDHDNQGLLTAFGIGDQVDIWSDTRESLSSIVATATVTTTGISLPVKSWLSLSDTSLQTSTSIDGATWGPFMPVTASGVIQSPPYRWIRVNSGSATVTYNAMPKRLSGIVLQTLAGQDGPNIKTLQLSGQDYTSKTMNVLVSRAYQDQTYDYIIKDIINFYFAGEITTNNVQTGAGIVAYIQFSSKAAFSCFDQLSTMSGWDWYVDAEHDFHWFPASQNTNPIPITVVPGVGADVNRDSIQVTVDGSQMQNRITFYGGKYQSAPRTEYRTADGQTKTWQLTYNVATFVSNLNASQINPQTPLVWVNGVPQTVGQDGIDTGMDFYVRVGANFLRQSDSAATLASGTVIEIQYTYHIPLIIQQQVDASIAKYGLFEGAITDTAQTNRDTAVARVAGQLQQSAWPIVTAVLDTPDPSFASGQSAQFNLPAQGLSNQWMRITQVHHQITANDYVATITGYGVAD